MARKTDFTKKVNKEIDVTNIIATSNTKDTKDTKEEFRFSARFTRSEWSYLQEKKWTTRKSITAILQEYVEEDMKKHPEIIAGIDELNGK